MLSFNTWRDAHIYSAGHRQWFANQIMAMTGGHFDPLSMHLQGQQEASDTAVAAASSTKSRAEWPEFSQTKPLHSSEERVNERERADAEEGGHGRASGGLRFSPYPGETDETWQQRHGFLHLTPGAVKVFDASRRFREERDAQQAADEVAELEEEQENEGDDLLYSDYDKDEELPGDEEQEEDAIWHVSRQSKVTASKRKEQERHESASMPLSDEQGRSDGFTQRHPDQRPPGNAAPAMQGSGTRAKKRQRKQRREAKDAEAVESAREAALQSRTSLSELAKSTTPAHPPAAASAPLPASSTVPGGALPSITELEALRRKALMAKRGRTR